MSPKKPQALEQMSGPLTTSGDNSSHKCQAAATRAEADQGEKCSDHVSEFLLFLLGQIVPLGLHIFLKLIVPVVIVLVLTVLNHLVK